MKVALCCCAGMSTSIFVKKMETYAKQQEIDLEIAAYGVGDINDVARNYDLILLGPQVSNQKNRIAQNTGKPVAVISPLAYGRYKVDEVFAQIDELLK